MIKFDDADCFVAGGTRSHDYRVGDRRLFRDARAFLRNEEPERASRPFDRDRDGFVMGEGAGLVSARGTRATRKSAAPTSTASFRDTA